MSHQSFRIFLGTLLTLVLGVQNFGTRRASGGELPQNSRAREAISQRESIARKLRLDYFSKLVEADAQLVKQLDVALRVAAAGGADAEEIQRITAARSKAQEMHKQDLWEAQGIKEFSIKADAGWQDTVELHKGDAVTVQASGEWTWDRRSSKGMCGPDGIGGGSPAQGSLIGLISGQPDETSTQIGSKRQFVAGADGVLQLGMRGHNPIGSGQNDGTLEVLIKVVPGAH
jgi:hypothetical protein